MIFNRCQSNGTLGLKIGEIVEVKSASEIIATLDKRGELDGLPFMPEMLPACGRRWRVRARAVKLCDTVNASGFHRMDNAVHLDPVDGEGGDVLVGGARDGLRCDGTAHGGCQAACLIYWKEAWLRRVSISSPTSTPSLDSRPIPTSAAGVACTTSTLLDATRADGGVAARGEERWSCQATELPKAATVHLPWWDVWQYVHDVRAGNARPAAMLRSLAILLFNKFQAANRKFLPRLPLIHGAKNYPFVDGTLAKTPHATLDLRPGERVRVKSREEIFATLDTKGRNRGLQFDAEMLRYCGRQTRVRARVGKIVDEKTGRMLRFGSDSVILEGAICVADYNQYCPRAIYPYWREIWLERTP